MGRSVMQQGYFSLLRWRADPARDECRNVAVVLVDAEGQFGGVRPGPVSSFSRKLREQGILDSILEGMRQQFESADRPDLAWLRGQHARMQRSLLVTEPTPTAVPDPAATLESLYRAFVIPRNAVRSSVVTKGRLLDRVVDALRKEGSSVHRGEYFSEFLFDAIEESAGLPTLIEALSFATTAKSFVAAEHDAGHYLYALRRVSHAGAFAVIEPPGPGSTEAASISHERVLGWFEAEKVAHTTLDGLPTVVAAR